MEIINFGTKILTKSQLFLIIFFFIKIKVKPLGATRSTKEQSIFTRKKFLLLMKKKARFL